MVSRRHFLSASAAASVFSVFPHARAIAQATNHPEAESATALPPSIAALGDRRAEAQPISAGERETRYEHARRLMGEHGLDAICLIGGTSLVYYTGIRWWNSERLFTFVLPQKGSPFYV